MSNTNQGQQHSDRQKFSSVLLQKFKSRINTAVCYCLCLYIVSNPVACHIWEAAVLTISTHLLWIQRHSTRTWQRLMEFIMTFTSYLQTLFCVLRRRNSLRSDGKTLSSYTLYCLVRSEARTDGCSFPCWCRQSRSQRRFEERCLCQNARADFPGKSVVESNHLTIGLNANTYRRQPLNRYCWCHSCNRVVKSKLSPETVSNTAKAPFKGSLT